MLTVENLENDNKLIHFLPSSTQIKLPIILTPKDSHCLHLGSYPSILTVHKCMYKHVKKELWYLQN